MTQIDHTRDWPLEDLLTLRNAKPLQIIVNFLGPVSLRFRLVPGKASCLGGKCRICAFPRHGIRSG